MGHNIEEIKPEVAARALLFSILGSLILVAAARVWAKDWHRASFLAILSLALFFSYGHVYSYLEQAQIFSLTLGRHRFLTPLWAALFLLGAWWASRPKRRFALLTGPLNLIAVLLLIFPLLQIGQYSARSFQAAQEHRTAAASEASLHLPEGQPAPDIYYIILDAYARDDVLLQTYGLDNTPFIEELNQLGFYVAPCSQSNYAQTQLSLSSSLNFNYLQEISEDYQPGKTTRAGIEELIWHSAARQELEAMGYTSIAFETGFKGTQWEDADYYFTPKTSTLEGAQILTGINDFEALLLKNSAALLLVDGASALPKFFQPDFNNPRRIHRERILFVFDQLSKIPEMPGPKLVFAHIVAPHPPYVFGPGGEYIDRDLDDRTGYPAQVRYLNQSILPLVEAIIKKSSVPPVIVLQGDHGATKVSPNKRMSILNAYYLPGRGGEALYPGISPVNTFRVIFNTYFEGSYPLLEDTSYFSGYERPFDFEIIPETRPDCP